MMRISTKSDYGVQVLLELATFPGHEFVSLKEIAKAHRMPYRFLAQIMAALKKGGFVESREGVLGGYRLTKSPKDIHVGDVLALFEKDLALMRCTSHSAQCPIVETCPSRPSWQKIQSAVTNTLFQLTLKDLQA